MKVPILKNILPLNASPLSGALLTFHKMLRVKFGEMPESWVSYSMGLSHMELSGCSFLGANNLFRSSCRKMFCLCLSDLFVPEADPDISGVLPVLQVLSCLASPQ